MSKRDLDYRIGKLKVKPGDMLVAKVDAVLSAQMIDALQKQFKAHLPAGVETLIIERGIDLSVLTFDEIQARAKTAEAA